MPSHASTAAKVRAQKEDARQVLLYDALVIIRELLADSPSGDDLRLLLLVNGSAVSNSLLDRCDRINDARERATNLVRRAKAYGEKGAS